MAPDSVARVLHVLASGDVEGTGIYRIVRSIALASDPARYSIETCFLQGDSLAAKLRRDGVPSTCVSWNSRITDLAGVVRYATFLQRTKADIVHLHSGGRLLAGISRKFGGARVVLSHHSRAWEELGVATGVKRFPKVDALIVNSQATADYVGVPGAIVIYPGVDLPTSKPARVSDEVVIGTACRLEPIKQIEILIEAFSMLVRDFPKIRLRIAGEGSQRKALEDRVAALGLTGYTSFNGWTEELQHELESWDIFVIASVDEGFGLAALEAMASGLPVIASAAGGLRELVTDGESGFLVPPGSAADFANRLRQLIQDPIQRRQMGDAGRKRASSLFSASQMAAKHYALYDDLLHRAPYKDA